MNAIELICTRRSIRKYTGKQVSENDINELLKAAMYAPSARNQRPWHFIVLRQSETLKAITQIHPFSSMLNEASVAIVVCADLLLEQSEGYWVQDCAAATQNILLASHSLGLGSVWLGVHPRAERSDGIAKLFQLPENIKPFSIVAIGYPNEEKPQPERVIPERIHFEKW